MRRYDRKRLAEVLEVQGRQVNWLADATGYDPSTVSRFLSGAHPISDNFAWLEVAESETSVA
jgi:hypothetical protein